MPIEQDVSSLPDEVRSVSIKEQKVFDGIPFPLILSPSEAFKDNDSQFWNDWVKRNIQVIEGLLLKYGAILFRGFPFETPTEFDAFANAYDYNAFVDIGGVGVRVNVVGNVYTANESPPGSMIPFHHEMAHVKDYPLILFFYCDLPAKEGGDTPLALSNVIYRKMAERDPAFVNRLEKEGLQYVRVAPDGNNSTSAFGRSWQATFRTTDKEEAERNAKASGYDVEWLEDGRGLKTITKVLPAIRVDKRTGKKMWFNSVFTFSITRQDSRNDKTNAAIFPNGDHIRDETTETMKQVMDEARVSFTWQRKDVVIIDNRAVQHSRSDFFVPPRRILASLYKDHQGPI